MPPLGVVSQAVMLTQRRADFIERPAHDHRVWVVHGGYLDSCDLSLLVEKKLAIMQKHETGWTPS